MSLLHPHTLSAGALTIALVLSLMLGVISLRYAAPERTALRWFSAACLLGVIALLLRLLHGEVSFVRGPFLSTVAITTCMVYWLHFQLEGLRCLTEPARPWLLHTVPGLLIALVTAARLTDTLSENAADTLLHAGIGVMALLLTLQLMRHRPRLASIGLMMFVWIVCAAWYFTQSLLLLYYGSSEPVPLMWLTPLMTIGGGIISVYGIVAVTVARNQALLTRLATTDALTSAMNRRGIEQRAAQLLHRLAERNVPVALLMIDFDHFKQVNDTWGHLAGDRLLALFTQMALAQLRNTDVFGRIGGEEFVALLPGVTSLAAARQTADRLRTEFASRSITVNNQRVHATVTIGVVHAMIAPAQLTPLLQAADEAMYAAKSRGRNQTIAAVFSHDA